LIYQRSKAFMRKNGNVSPNEGLARGLGWFSIGLGLAQLLAPRALARLVGVKNHRALIRAVGLREITSGIGILSQVKPRGWVWARVGGDVMDLAMIGSAMNDKHASRGRLTTAAVVVAGVTAVDTLCGRRLSREQGALHVRKSITINKSPEEIYRFWRNFENLPRFMAHLQSVRVLDEKRSHWVAKGPAGSSVEWDAEILEDRPNELIRWRTLPGADVDNSGAVTFHPATGGRGTVVTVEFEYQPPAGVFGATVAKLLGQAPEKQVPVDLLRFRQVLETGVMQDTEGQPAGRPKSTSRRFDDLVRK
jgi:uncharacterized membrane protein